MILTGFIIITLLYYFILVKLNEQGKATFKAVALDVIGSSTTSPEAIKEDIFGPTNDSTSTSEAKNLSSTSSDASNINTDSSLEKSLDTETLIREEVFSNSTMDDRLSVEQKEIQRQDLLKELNTSSNSSKEDTTSINTTNSEVAGESISDFTTKEELEQIVSELGYNDSPDKEPDLIEEIDATQLLEFFNDYKELYQQEAQEVIEFNTKRTMS